MGKKKIVMVVLGAALCLLPALGHGAEGLFDTKAAASHTEKGIAFLKARNYDAAIKEFEESISIAPEAEAFYYLGYAYYLKGKQKDGTYRRKARENFDKAYELDPNFTPARLGAAGPGAEKTRPEQGRALQPASAETATPGVQPPAPEQSAEQPRAQETATPQPEQPAQTGEPPTSQPQQMQPVEQPRQ